MECLSASETLFLYHGPDLLERIDIYGLEDLVYVSVRDLEHIVELFFLVPFFGKDVLEEIEVSVLGYHDSNHPEIHIRKDTAVLPINLFEVFSGLLNL